MKPSDHALSLASRTTFVRGAGSIFSVTLLAAALAGACSSGGDSGAAATGGVASGQGGNTALAGAATGAGGSSAVQGGSPGQGGNATSQGGSSTQPGSQGGAANSGGSASPSGSSGAVGTGGSSQAGSGNSGGTSSGSGQGGSTAGASNGSGGATNSSGGASQAGSSGSGGGSSSAEKFSFFMTSQAGLFKLAQEFNGSSEGFGGDLRFGKADGLSGADEICKRLAETTMPNNGKTWRAFLSATAGPDGKPVNAIDRVGEGPWYDRKGRLFAMNKAALLNERPAGIDAVIRDDFPNEEGVPNHDPGTGIIDNHNVLTGSSTSGTVDMNGKSATCQDWTSSEAMGGKPRCGVSWPRVQFKHWISVLNEGGCAPGATPGNGAESGPRGTVGALGGYGGFYCFALTP